VSAYEVADNRGQMENLPPINIGLRLNNFDLLRFLLAFVVFLVHAYELTGNQSLSILIKLFSSKIAVS